MSGQPVHLPLWLDVVPLERTPGPVSLSVLQRGNLGGAIRYDKKGHIVELFLPEGNTAKERFVRVHEGLHSRHSTPVRGGKYPNIVHQFIEDCRIHTHFWPKTASDRLNRDGRCVVLQDLRHIVLNPPKTAPHYNLALGVTLRCLAIGKRIGGAKHYQRLLNGIQDLFTYSVFNKLQNIIAHVDKKQFHAAKKKYYELLVEDSRDKKPDQGNCGPDQGRPDHGSCGKTVEHPMDILTLPMTEPCLFRAKVRRPCPAGRLIPARILPCLQNRTTQGLFIQQRRLPNQGTVVFDASGSMGLEDEELRRLCRTAPGAQVAYYSSYAKKPGCYGTLVLYAQGGLRYAGKEMFRKLYNAVDLFALQWLLKQPGPRIFVSDGYFCDGPKNQDIQCHKLLMSNVLAGTVIWLQSVEEAKKYFSPTGLSS